MGPGTLFRRPRRATLRVSAEGAPATFDALLVFDGGPRRRAETRVLRGECTPFTLDLPDRDVTVVVQPRERARRLVAEYVREVGGRRVLWGRSWLATPVLQRRGGGILCAGLPAPEESDGAGAGSVAPAS
ncbi:MAG: hypothetical protein M3282_02525 [Gemmatimonadota bacterium]|nr:hypothetical protein [Gemmatimonadota bacterium]